MCSVCSTFKLGTSSPSIRFPSPRSPEFQTLKLCHRIASLFFLRRLGVRLHLMILYAFCRVTDDMIDNELDAGRKKRKLSLIERFVGELFANRRSDYEVNTVATASGSESIDWTSYRSELTDEELSCFRAVSRISFYLPRKPFHELLEGYRWDVEGKPVRTENDLLLYSTCVAGSVGTLCVYVMMYKSGSHCTIDGNDFTIRKARQMGQVQLYLKHCSDNFFSSKNTCTVLSITKVSGG